MCSTGIQQKVGCASADSSYEFLLYSRRYGGCSWLPRGMLCSEQVSTVIN